MRRRVFVIGGGPAGLMAAAVSARLGHEVILFERNRTCGGQLLLACRVPGKSTFQRLANDLIALALREGVEIVTEIEVDEKLIERERPAAVIVATGSRPKRLDIAGKGPPLVSAWSVLSGEIQTGTNIVVVGGNALGLETALFLARCGTPNMEALGFLFFHNAFDTDFLRATAYHGVKRVTVVEKTGKAGKDIGPSTRWTLMKALERAEVRVLTCTEGVGLEKEGLVVKTKDRIRTLEADTIVYAVGSVPEDSVVKVLGRMGIPFLAVGDAKVPGTAMDAIHSGYEAGLQIL